MRTKEHYLHDGRVAAGIQTRVETIHLVIRQRHASDTLIFTHHGPVYETEKETSLNDIVQQNHALRWIGHDESNELRTFYMLNRATGYEDFRDAFRTYRAPAQNVNYAGTDGNIAIQTGGCLAPEVDSFRAEPSAMVPIRDTTGMGLFRMNRTPTHSIRNGAF
jgi:penicillin G amidase